MSGFQIFNFYEFKLLPAEALPELKAKLRDMLLRHDISGTIIIAEEGFNASLCGREENVRPFILDDLSQEDAGADVVRLDDALTDVWSCEGGLRAPFAVSH